MLTNFIKDESGQGMVEYGLVIALIGTVVIAALAAMGNSTAEIIDGSANAVDRSVEGSAIAPDFSGQTETIVNSADTIVEQAEPVLGQ